MQMLQERLDHPGAWKGIDFKSKADLTFHLTPEHIREIDGCLDAACAKGLKLEDLEREHFALPGMAGYLAGIREDLRNGRGIAIIRGLDVARYTKDQMGMIYWGLGTHFGTGVSQSVLGDRLGHVINMTKTDPHARAYRNKQELTPHTDLSDIVGLCCLSTAKTGGMSVATSALAVHNELLERYPDYLPPLYEGFVYHRLGEQLPGSAPVTPYRVPVFSYRGGQLSCRYVRSYIETAAKDAGQPLTPLQVAALNCVEMLTYECAFEFHLDPGEIYLINNYTVLHARSAFEDWDDDSRKRHLLRLWLTAPDWRDLDPHLEIYDGSAERGGIPAQPGKSPSYAGAIGSSRMAG